LISDHIDSVGALDLLLLLHGARDRDWSSHELCRTLRCPAPWADEQLRRMIAIGVIAEVSEGRYRYTRAGEYGPALDEIARACRRDRAAVTRLVFARASHGPSQFAR
jgi:hypothetical protein